MHYRSEYLKEDTSDSLCVCVHAWGNKRAEECDMVPRVSVNIPTLVIGIEYW